MKAVKCAQPVLGIVLQQQNSVIITINKVQNSLMQMQHTNKIQQIDDHIFCVASGFISDAQYLIQQARHVCQEYLLNYDEPIPIENLVIEIADLIHHVTQYGSLRPYGVSFQFFGLDPRDNKLKLFNTDPSGIYQQHIAFAQGKNCAEINSNLKKRLSIDEINKLSVDEIQKLALKIVSQSIQKSNQTQQQFEVFILSKTPDNKIETKYLEDDFIQQELQEFQDENDEEEAEEEEQN